MKIPQRGQIFSKGQEAFLQDRKRFQPDNREFQAAVSFRGLWKWANRFRRPSFLSSPSPGTGRDVAAG